MTPVQQDEGRREGEYRSLSDQFARWAVVCAHAGEIIHAENCRADASIYARMADNIERKAVA